MIEQRYMTAQPGWYRVLLPMMLQAVVVTISLVTSSPPNLNVTRSGSFDGCSNHTRRPSGGGNSSGCSPDQVVADGTDGNGCNRYKVSR